MSTSKHSTIYYGPCQQCGHGTLVKTTMREAHNIGTNLFYISNPTNHYECNFCGASVAGLQAINLLYFASSALSHMREANKEIGFVKYCEDHKLPS